MSLARKSLKIADPDTGPDPLNFGISPRGFPV